MKAGVKIIFRDIALCPVDQMLSRIEAFLRFLDAVQSVPLGIKHINQEGERTSVYANCVPENAVFAENLGFIAGHDFHKVHLLSLQFSF